MSLLCLLSLPTRLEESVQKVKRSACRPFFCCRTTRGSITQNTRIAAYNITSVNFRTPHGCIEHRALQTRITSPAVQSWFVGLMYRWVLIRFRPVYSAQSMLSPRPLIDQIMPWTSEGAFTEGIRGTSMMPQIFKPQSLNHPFAPSHPSPPSYIRTPSHSHPPPRYPIRFPGGRFGFVCF